MLTFIKKSLFGAGQNTHRIDGILNGRAGSEYGFRALQEIIDLENDNYKDVSARHAVGEQSDRYATDCLSDTSLLSESSSFVYRPTTDPLLNGMERFKLKINQQEPQKPQGIQH